MNAGIRLKLFFAFLLGMLPFRGGAVDLLERYPTTLNSGDSNPARAREWTFTRADIFQLDHFRFAVGDDFCESRMGVQWLRDRSFITDPDIWWT